MNFLSGLWVSDITVCSRSEILAKILAERVRVLYFIFEHFKNLLFSAQKQMNTVFSNCDGASG